MWGGAHVAENQLLASGPLSLGRLLECCGQPRHPSVVGRVRSPHVAWRGGCQEPWTAASEGAQALGITTSPQTRDPAALEWEMACCPREASPSILEGRLGCEVGSNSERRLPPPPPGLCEDAEGSCWHLRNST